VRLSRAREAEKRTTASEQLLAREAELTVLDAESLYWELVGAIADRAVLEKSLELTRELLEVAEARFEAGRGIPADVAEAEAGLARREGELIDVQARIGNLSDRLRELVMPFEGPGAALDLTILPVDIPAEGLDVLPEEPTRDGLEAALSQRTDVRAAQSNVDAAKQAELRAQNEDEYELNALLNGGLRGYGSGFNDTSDDWEDRDDYAWEAGLELAIPIGNITADARLRRAEQETRRAERQLAALRNVVVREIRVAVRDIRSSVDRIRVAKRERVATEAQLAAEQSRLEKGKSTPFRVLEKEEDRSRAIATEVRARVDLENARAALESAKGSLLEERDLQDLVVGE
jgi:outer membrane protein TolC